MDYYVNQGVEKQMPKEDAPERVLILIVSNIGEGAWLVSCPNSGSTVLESPIDCFSVP